MLQYYLSVCVCVFFFLNLDNLPPLCTAVLEGIGIESLEHCRISVEDGNPFFFGALGNHFAITPGVAQISRSSRKMLHSVRCSYRILCSSAAGAPADK